MATGGSDFTSDDIIHNKCFLCDKDNRRREGEQYCMQCMKYLCSSCVETHNNSPFTDGHQILNKSDFRTLGEDRTLPSTPTQRCAQHPLRVIDMFCRDHDEVTCAACVALNHRSCKTILFIQDEVDQLCQIATLSKVKQTIRKCKDNMEEIRQRKECKVQDIRNSLDKEIESVRSFRRELQSLLDEMERESIEELKNLFHKMETSLTEEINEAKSLVNALIEATSELKQSEGNKAQEFVTMKCLEKINLKCEHFQRHHETLADESICFTPDPSIRQMYKQFKTLGKVYVDKENTTSQQQNKATPKDGLYKVKSQREINLQLESDHGICCIYASCFTKEGDILLADYGNMKLKLLDMRTEEVKDHIDLQCRPWCVCLISEKEAAVTLDNNTVQFVSLSSKMTTTRSLSMNHRCYGLAYINDKLYISDCSETLYIYDMSGKKLQRISTDTSGNNIFRHIQYVTFTEDRILVTDFVKGLVVLDLQGNYICTVESSSASECQGVCTDGRNVFVGGYRSGSIVQIGDNLQKCGEVVNVKRPSSVCLNYTTRMLIATAYDTDKIYVCELE